MTTYWPFAVTVALVFFALGWSCGNERNRSETPEVAMGLVLTLAAIILWTVYFTLRVVS